MSLTLIIDSNIWAYYFDKDSREHPLVAPRVEDVIKVEKVVINTVIVMEVAHFLIKNLGSVIGAEKVNTFLNFPFTVVDLDYALAQKSTELLQKYTHQGIGGRDATVLATAEKLSVGKLMTHDDAFKKIGWLKVIDPVLRST